LPPQPTPPPNPTAKPPAFYPHPSRPLRPLQKQKQQQNVRHEQQHIREMMSRRIPPIPLHIQHVRNPRERMPVGRRIIRTKRPHHVLPRNSMQHRAVSRHIIRIVEIHESILQRRRIKSRRQQQKQQSQHPHHVFGPRYRFVVFSRNCFSHGDAISIFEIADSSS